MRTMLKFGTVIAIVISIAVVLACRPETLATPNPTANAVQPETAPTPPTNSEPITIAAAGDIMMASSYPNETRMPPNDGADLFTEVAPIFKAADIAFGNLEGPIVDSGASGKCRPGSTRCFAFRTPTRYGKYLKDAGFDVMSLANNHAGDFGLAGRQSTQKVLDEQGIKYAGTLDPPATITYLESKGKKVAFVAFGHNNGMPSINDLEGAKQLVAQAVKNSHIVVVSFHGGAEGTNAQNVPNRNELFLGENRGNLPLFARTVIDAGADLVLGHGPHVLRGMEMYKDRLIAYSLGNFCTYGWFQLAGETALTGILETKLAADGKFVSGKFHSGKLIGRGSPALDPDGQATKVVRKLSEMDFGTNAPKIADDGTITAK
jgi:hypothetical protein